MAMFPSHDTGHDDFEPYRGNRVVDEHHRPVGRVRGVIYDPHGLARWAVVRVGWFQPERYVPLDNSYLTFDQELVVPFDKRTVARSPEAAPNHNLTPSAERVVEQYYRLAS